LRALQSGKVVEPFPFGEFDFPIDGAFATEQLVEFLLIRIVGPLELALLFH